MGKLAHAKSGRAASSRNLTNTLAREAARALWVDRWVSYPRAERILSRLDDLLYLPARVRMQNVLIHGTSGAGKSMVIEKFIRNHPLEADREDATRPIVSMQMPPLPTLRSFFSELLRSLDCTVIIGSRISELEHDTLRQLKKAKPRLLAIDEIHHLLACTPREQRAALNVLKFLSNELRVSIVALGTSEALHVMRTDPQIASRFESCALPSWTANEDLRRFLAGFLHQLEVEGSGIVNNRIAIDYILELTSGVTGRIVELLRLSARCAIRRDSNAVNVDLLQEAGKEFTADLGSERNVSH
jgi:Cdc6-like AAA superfamily ATPase